MEGWRFEPHQNKQLMKTKKFRTWYHTTFDRREFQLPEHFGCGSNKDPRHTIRIAFNWDEKTKKVVLGYLGQHQQTSAT